MKYKDEKEVHLIDLASSPLETVMGKEIGNMMAIEHTKNGVQLLMNKGIKEFKGTGTVSSVSFNDGSELNADLVLLGVGVLPSTEFVKGSKVDLD